MDTRSQITWGEFATQEPELAAFGSARLTAAPAYLATVRLTGAPRVHPVTPIFTTAGLYLFMEPTSPKGRDLRERGWFAMHSGVPDDAGTGGEFYLTGRGFDLDDPALWSRVADAATYTPVERYILFELQVTEVRCNGYGDVALPSTRRWSLGR
ncbi:MAG: pyridoxamine 5'-phosphate oxidase [Actinobacteria bacterium]|nr:pyridoxamine 5'-phosphate oxidase [Actinomycetota bacterium]MCI0544419.1 pyridoxamine 5'-phosphate oxidase [Actinomycetota bacterium]